jgi:curved DNA-binding protein CbpA
VLQNIKKQYKRLAILIHPDKCSIPIASNLFNVLQQGIEALIEHVECSEKARKKVKNDDKGEKDLFDEAQDDDDEFAWWTEWDNPNTGNNDGANAASTTEEVELQQKKEKEAKDDDVNFLTLMQPLEKLSEEVRARQNAMLSRPPPGKTLQDMKIALVRAKTILNDRLIKEKEVQAAASGGGFLI